MSDTSVRVRFALPPTGKPAALRPAPGERAERLRRQRAARRARRLALAYWIDGLVRQGQVVDLASVARMCGVSRTRVSVVLRELDTPIPVQEQLLASVATMAPGAASCVTGRNSLAVPVGLGDDVCLTGGDHDCPPDR